MSPRRPRLPRGFFALTAAKMVLTTAQRWVPALLPTLTTAFGASTTAMTSMMGLGQLGGLLTSITGQRLDARNERTFIIAGVAVVAASSAVALVGVPAAFALSFVLLVVGHTHVTVASHAWLGHRTPAAQRARAIGLFETSWSLGLLLGTPLLAAVVSWWTWRAGYAVLITACVISATVLWSALPRHLSERPHADTSIEPNPNNDWGQPPSGRSPGGLPKAAWAPIVGAGLLAMGGIGFFAIASTWLADQHGFSTAALGAVAVGYGFVELCAVSLVAFGADRLGNRRSVVFGMLAQLCAIAVMGSMGSLRLGAVIGMLWFLLSFEFAIVSSFALITEAAPNRRGAAIGIGNAVSTLGRAIGVGAVGPLYTQLGIVGPLGLVAATTVAALWLIGRSPIGDVHR